MSHQIEKIWKTKSGYRAVCLRLTTIGHRCGYVGIPKGHALFNKEYRHKLPKEFFEKLPEEKFNGSPIDILLAAYDSQEGCGPQLSYYFNVHGGITYADGADNGYPDPSEEGKNLWWFGFDCGHAGDTPEKCTQEYVEGECEMLASGLKEFENEQL